MAAPAATPNERRRARRQGRKPDGNRWMQTYGDAMTLLLAFFVMLYAMSQIDAVKFEAFIRGLEVPFGNPAVSEGMLPQHSSIVGDVDLPNDPRPEAIRLTDNLPHEPESGEDETPDEADDDPGPVDDSDDDDGETSDVSERDLEQLRKVQEALQTSMTQSGFAEAADFRIDERGLVVSISADDVLFALGSTTISGEGTKLVEAIADALRPFPNDIIVEGHTDDIPLDRNGYTNWNLSTDRAVAVLSMLFEEFDLSQERLGAAGYGEWRPRLPNDTPENRAVNRRVDVLVVAEGLD
jgi:chemotaxis protein MotB